MKLLYPSSNIIQHAGIMSVQGTPVYKLQYRRNAETQYFGFNKGIRNVLAVTGACMMVRKELFDRVGGFDEARDIRLTRLTFAFLLTKFSCGDIIS